MKIATLIFGFLVFLTTGSLGQSASDSTGTRQGRQQRRGLVDENADGIKDRRQRRQERMKRRTDRFIDTNGDGISDSRECGLGFRRGATSAANGTGKQSGKKGQGGK